MLSVRLFPIPTTAPVQRPHPFSLWSCSHPPQKLDAAHRRGSAFALAVELIELGLL
jgi:hypothetical protein